MRQQRHGLAPPYPAQQWGLLVAFLMAVIHFYGFVAPVVPGDVGGILAAVYSTGLAMGTAAYLYVALVDTAVPNGAGKEALERGDGHVRLCRTCEDYMPPRAKHCKICGICVEQFDHHCLYLNACIGKRNHRMFIGMLVIATSFLLLQLTYFSFIVADVIDADATIRRDYGGIAAYIPLSLVFALVSFALLCGTVPLLLFHVYISYHGITTYEWLTRRREHHDRSMTSPAPVSRRYSGTIDEMTSLSEASTPPAQHHDDPIETAAHVLGMASGAETGIV